MEPNDIARGMDKKQVSAALEEVANLLELSGASVYEIRAYQAAARAVDTYDGDIEALARSGKTSDIPGIGKTLSTAITELVTTGQFPLLTRLLAEVPDGLRQMLRIPGLGPKRIRQIHQALAITTIAQLQHACETNQVAALPGFGAKSQDKILKGITFLTANQGAYRLDIAETEANAIADALRALPQIVRLSLAGSLRRRKETVHDADIVASVAIGAPTADRLAIMNHLVTLPQIADITGKGETKSSVILRSGMPLDLRVVADDEYPYALHHFTGSKEHHLTLRGRAHADGVKINEYGLFRDGHRIPCANETDIYAALGMPYIEPELREGRGEIEAALAGQLPTLVTLTDLQGYLHVHSNWSDGGASIHDMAEAARALGAHYLGLCDHSKAAAYAHGLTEDTVRRQHDEIDRLNAAYHGAFHILKGTECDILKDGSLDYDDATLATFDFVVASVHSHFQLTPAEQTQRLIRAIENPYCSILGHPTGRIILGREGYAPDLEAVIERAAALGVAIELNGDPHRMDLDWRLIRHATQRGVRIPITTDAHSPAGLANIHYGVGAARKGWLTPQHTLNALPLDQLTAFFTAQRASRHATA